MEEKNKEENKETEKTFSERPKYIMLEKTKALYTMLHPYLELFPKNERFTLRQRIEDTVLELIKLLVIQNYQQTNEERKAKILEFLADIYLLEVLLQQSSVFKYLSYEAFDRCMHLVIEINNFALSRFKNLGGTNENI